MLVNEALSVRTPSGVASHVPRPTPGAPADPRNSCGVRAAPVASAHRLRAVSCPGVVTMNESLRSAIVDLATRFADEVLDVVSAAVVDEVVRANGGGPGRRARRLRRSDEELRAAEERILGAL